MLGLCPALAVTTTVYNAIGMSAGTIFVLICSNIMISLLKRVIPDMIHIPAYIVIIAGFVTVVDLSMQAFAPDLSKSLGAFVPLIVVNCVILGRAEAFASQNPVGKSIVDAIAMGLGFAFALVLIAFFRELPGNGTITIWGKSLWATPMEFPIAGSFKILLKEGQIVTPLSRELNGTPLFVMVLPAGALFVVGYLKGAFMWILDRNNGKRGASA